MRQIGQALVSLIVIISLVTVLLTSIVFVSIDQSKAALDAAQSKKALYLAETGIENAILMLLRNPTYSGGTFSVDGSSVDVNVAGGTIKTITSKATSGTHIKKVEVEVDTGENKIQLISWRQIP